MITVKMAAEKKIYTKKSTEDSCCTILRDGIINYVFDVEGSINDTNPAVTRICKNMNNTEKEALNNLFNKFYKNLSENKF